MTSQGREHVRDNSHKCTWACVRGGGREGRVAGSSVDVFEGARTWRRE